MTLRELQKIIKLSVVIGFVGVYGIAAFSLGQITASVSGEVKGQTTLEGKSEIIEKPLPYADVQSTNILASSVKFCSNTEKGFELSYPSDWFTTHNLDDQKCLYFAPYSFVVPHFVDNDFAPVKIEIIEPDLWSETIKFVENPNDFYYVLSSKNLEFNGKLAKKIISRSTGEGLSPRGYFFVHFLIFDSESPIHLTYTQLDEDENSQAMVDILEEITRSVKYL